MTHKDNYFCYPSFITVSALTNSKLNDAEEAADEFITPSSFPTSLTEISQYYNDDKDAADKMSTQSDYQAKTWNLSFLLRVHSLVIDGCRIHTSLVQSAAAVQTYGAVISPAVKLCGPSKNKCVHCGGARGPRADRMEVLMSAKERKSNAGAHTHAHKHTGSRVLEPVARGHSKPIDPLLFSAHLYMCQHTHTFPSVASRVLFLFCFLPRMCSYLVKSTGKRRLHLYANNANIFGGRSEFMIQMF